MAGALTFEAGYTAARSGEIGTARRYWDQARAMADRLQLHGHGDRGRP
ncbi:hypothetical protein [Streptomyces sp. NPDC060065]